MKLIDKNKLLKELKKLKQNLSASPIVVIEDVESLVESLETKELDIDIEKEVIDWWNAHYSSKAYTFEGYTGHYLENSTLIEIARHFYELGLAQKGE